MAKENIEKLLYLMNEEAKKLKEANSPVVFLYDKIVNLENEVKETFSNLENKISLASKENSPDAQIERVVMKVAMKLVDIEKGDKGDDGKDGYTPVKGVDYFDGYTPVKGVDYFDGINGLNGKDGYTPIKGVDYFDGESVDETSILKTVLSKIPNIQPNTPEQLRDKLESIENEEEKLSINAIKGWKDIINNINNIALSVRGGGGSGGVEVFNSTGKIGSGSALKFVGTGISSMSNDGHTTTITINTGSGGGSGDVVGPASATDNAITRYDGTTGKLIQNSTVTLSDDGIIGTVKAINYDLTQTGASTEGRAIWDDNSKTLEIGLKNGFPLKVGEQLIELCVNNTGSTIAKGKVVYVNGGSGNRPTITLADNTSDLTSARTFGVTAEAIADNNSGYVVVTGIVTGLNTNAYTAGTQLYLSTSGDMTSTKPVAPAHMVYVARVITQSATVGVLYVQTQNGYELDELHDVLISTPITGQVLSYNSSDSLWKNSSVFSAMELSSTETPNGSRTTFTFSTATSQPSCLVVDGVWTKATSKSGTVNWTWDSGTKVATLTIPAQDDIWAIK
jgi:hypothetical protein